MKLVISPQAAEDIDAATRWWIANRPAAPDLFERELLQSLEFIATTPMAGAALLSGRGPGARRVPLPRTRYLLYYRVLEAEGEVRVLRLWHATRGAKPRL